MSVFNVREVNSCKDCQFSAFSGNCQHTSGPNRWYCHHEDTTSCYNAMVLDDIEKIDDRCPLLPKNSRSVEEVTLRRERARDVREAAEIRHQIAQKRRTAEVTAKTLEHQLDEIDALKRRLEVLESD